MSMNPGATAQPVASSSCGPRRLEPISSITPPLTAMSADRPGAPLPSKTVPPRMTTSADMLSLLGVGDELQQVAVRIAHVDAQAGGLPTALTLGRPLDDLGACLAEQRLQRLSRSVPDEAEVAAGRPR